MFSNIPEEEIRKAGVVNLPDSPSMSSTEVKSVFDQKGDMAISAFNKHIEEISDETAAANIGAVAPTGVSASNNLQAILTGIALLTVAASELKHSHENKSVLDGITSGQFAGYDSLVTNYGSITPATSINALSNTNLPTSKAVADYLSGQMNSIFDMVYPVGAIVISDVAPVTIYGRGTWTSQGAVGDFTAYKRTA